LPKLFKSVPLIIRAFNFFSYASAAPTGSTGECAPGIQLAGINFR